MGNDPWILYLNNGEGTFEICVHWYDVYSDTDTGPWIMEVLRDINLRTAKPIDVNGDSKMDLVVVHDREKDGVRIGRIDIWKNNGSSDFNLTVVLEWTEDGGSYDDMVWTDVVVADFDNDGAMDLFFTSDGGKNGIFFNDGMGKFEACIRSNDPLSAHPHSVLYTNCTGAGDLLDSVSFSKSAVAFDADGDGDIDLYVANTEAPNELLLNCETGFSMLPGRKTCAPSPIKPKVTSITQTAGETSGGEIAVVRGWLGSDRNKGSVKIGNKPCEIYNYASIMTWLCIIPEGLGASGTVPVVVESYGHSSDPVGNIFHYQGPIVTSISPNYLYPGSWDENLQEGQPPSLDPVFEITGKNFGARAEDKHLFLYWNRASVLDEESIQREYSGNGYKCIVQESDDSWKTFHERFMCRVIDEAFMEDNHIFQVYLAIGGDGINIDWEDFEPTWFAGEETFEFSNY